MKEEFIDMGILWVLCLLSVVVYGSGGAFVAASLASISVVCISATVSVPYLSEIITGMYIGVMILCPEFISFAPLIIYYIVSAGFYWHILSLIMIVAYSFVMGIMDYSFSYLVFAAISAVAIILCYKTRQYEELNRNYRMLRDDETENRLRLQDKNHELIVKQDYEVHLATLKERNRIAREIHDNVGHMLTRAILVNGALITMEKDENIKASLTVLSDTLNQAMDNIRESVHNLYDDSINLKGAIEELVPAFPAFDIRLDYNMSTDVPKDIKFCFIAICKEALNNASKYSNGDKINIILREQPGFYQLVISDNGKVNNKAFTGGIGIANMQERVRKLNGSFNINTDNGFRINASIMK